MKILNCYGINCCHANLNTFYLDYYTIDVLNNATSSSRICNVAAGLINSSLLSNFVGNLSSLRKYSTVVLDWKVEYAAHKSPFPHSSCYDNTITNVQKCDCDFNYEGNPHIPDGCQLVRGCQGCKHHCSYNDSFITGSGTPFYCEKGRFFNRASIIGFSISTGLVLLLLICYWLYRLVKRIVEIKQKAEHFKRNGGLLLQQKISSSDGIVEKTRIFGFKELQKATDSFSEDRILGQGGQGTVYKGMLVDGSIVAIKRSKRVDKNRLEQFINEMVILSLINHRNVVKLLGCCLETEVPLLVYEFILNGTLFHHIQDPSEDFHITWKMRLQIASESASAIAYLHSSASAPIYHRDIKSSNLLLDEKYRAKVSDFGNSRAISIDQTHVTTCVQGTYGYLDPEYFQSNQFTEKSDVYSFGVVLAELITGKKPLFLNKSGTGWTSLATEFVSTMKNSSLFELLDARISEEAKKEEVIAVANLANQCLNMKGIQRPTMKEVAAFLNEIRSSQIFKEKVPECLEESECVAVEYNWPSSTSTSFLVDCPPISLSKIEELPFMASY
ncbi:unnamed protein product [Amaranthus hypochondriacus]